MSMLARRSRRAVTAALTQSQRLKTVQQIPRTLLVPTVCYNAASDHQNRQWSPWSSRSFSSTTTEDSFSTAPATHDGNANSGMEIVPKNDKDALFLRGLRRFYELEGHFFVPPDYVVPSPPTGSNASTDADASSAWPEDLWGHPLGLRMRNFARGMMNDYKKTMLKSVGFPYDDWKTYVWEEQLMPSLRAFKQIEGHTFVRFPYVVPADDTHFPACAWGFKLGFAVALLRQQRESLSPEQLATLSDMDFIWTENHFKLKVLFIPALTRFKAVFGHTEVPSKFVIPEKADETLWPKSIHDTKLGYLYGCLKTGFFDTDTVTDCAAELQAIGVFEADGAQRVWANTVLPALGVFPEVFGHREIPSDFVVPSEVPWPEASWGYRLGYVVQCTLKEGVFSDQVAASKPELRSLGYRWNVLFGRWARQLLPGLRTYKEVFGHCDVPPTFVVPNDEPWPEESRKYHLGRQLQLVRKLGRSSPEVKDGVDEFDALGFKFNVAESDFIEKILPSLHTYAAKHGHCDIPRGFVVPSDDSWPKKAWGLKLATAASAIRARKQYRKQVDEHRDELKALGFSWPIPHTTSGVDRDIVQPCIAIYKEVYGEDALPDPDFVVPANDKRWPVEASGFKLGRWLQTHGRRRRLTNEIGSRESAGSPSIRASPGRPPRRVVKLEPHQEQYWNDVLMSSFQAYASLHGSCSGMDDNFVVPSEAPFPNIAWGLNLGLRVRYIRHHDRYAAEVDKYRAQLEVLGVVESTDNASSK